MSWTRSTTRPLARWIAALGAVVLLAVACGDDETGSSESTGSPPTTGASSSTSTSTTTTIGAPLTASFRGVTEDRIEIGIASVDFNQMFDIGFVDFTHGDEVAIWDALIADVNADGGIHGRQLTAVHDTYLPVGSVEAEESCLIFTEDHQVFAVLGLWVGESVLCLTDQHETIHVGHLVRQEWIDRSRAPLVSPDALEERQVELLLTVLLETGRLAGRTVGVLTDQNAESSVDTVVRPFGDANGITMATVGVLGADGDTVALSAQVETFTERWRVEGIDLLLVVGNNGVNAIPGVREVLGDIDVAVPSSTLLRQASGFTSDGDRPLFDGTLSLAGLSTTDGEQFAEPLLQDCIGVVETAVPGLTVVHPGELVEKEDWFTGIVNACSAVTVFVAAATAAGPELTNDSFEAGLESLGSIDLPGKAFASFGPGKRDGDDGFRLVSFDPLDGEEGSFTPLTDIVDTAAE